MNPTDDQSIPSIGYDLLSHAQEFGEPNRLPLTTQLFPFLFLASRRMTTREMSEWLEKTKNVKLSAPMISKGLKRPDLHLRRIAEHVQPLADFLSALSNQKAKDLLFGEKYSGSGITLFQEFEDHIWQKSDQLSQDIQQALRVFSDTWDQIPNEVKFMCLPYFDFGDDEYENDSEDSTSPQES